MVGLMTGYSSAELRIAGFSSVLRGMLWENLMVPQIPVFGSSFMGHGTSGCLDKTAEQLIEARWIKHVDDIIRMNHMIDNMVASICPIDSNNHQSCNKQAINRTFSRHHGITIARKVSQPWRSRGFRRHDKGHDSLKLQLTYGYLCEQWKKPWLVGLYRGLYYPVI